MTGGEAIVRALLQQEVDTVFGIPGVQTYGLYDALAGAAGEIAVYGARHEQTCGYMAFGYARSTGRPGVFTVVPGPGVLNAGAALCTAYGASAPVVCITGQVPTEYIGSGKGHLHELPDQLLTLRTLTKWAERIDRPQAAPALVAEAFRQATGGRPRPVALEMPWEVFAHDEPVELVAPASAVPPPEPDGAAVEQAAALLGEARNPMIMVGGGAVEAGTEIRALAELLQAPVVPFRSGRGIVGDDHHLGFTCAEGFERWPETDVVLGVGTRLELQWFRWPDPPAGLRLVTVDIDPTHAGRFGADVGIVGDARRAVAVLTDAVCGRTVARASREDEFEEVKRRVRGEIAKVQPHVEYLAAIREVLPRDGFFVEEICQTGFASYYAFPVYEPRTFVTCGHQGTLGFGFPTALGVKAANPSKPVVSIAGDGGFMFGVQELATAAAHGLDVTVVVFDNGAFGNVRRDQKRLYGRTLGSELRNPDFVAVAESFGATGARARTPDELRTALDHALGSGGPALIHVPLDPDAEVSPWGFLMPGRYGRP
jgi:acetolactate synthase I/II/III large subunit